MGKKKYSTITKYISELQKEINFFQKKNLNILGITKTEAIYIRMIYENPGLTQYEIAKRMNVVKTLVIKYVSILEKKEIISKKDIELYKKEINLTEKGLNIYKEFAELFEFTENTMFKGLSQREISKYIEITKLIKKNLNEFNQRNINESDISYNKWE